MLTHPTHHLIIWAHDALTSPSGTTRYVAESTSRRTDAQGYVFETVTSRSTFDTFPLHLVTRRIDATVAIHVRVTR